MMMLMMMITTTAYTTHEVYVLFYNHVLYFYISLPHRLAGQTEVYMSSILTSLRFPPPKLHNPHSLSIPHHLS